MPKTIENYIRMMDVAGMQGDAKVLAEDGNRTQGSTFIPLLNFDRQRILQQYLEPVFGDAVDQIFAIEGINPEQKRPEYVLASGICALPMEYNSRLNPLTGQPGTSLWRDCSSLESIALPPNIIEAVSIILANPPPITVPNLLKAGGVGLAPTILIEEVNFYANWILEKLIANCATNPSLEEINEQKLRLVDFVRQQYNRNIRCFEKLRQLVTGDVSLQPCITVEDTQESYQEAINEKISKWQRDLIGGAKLDKAGLTVAAYYSDALTKAYRSIGVLPVGSQLIIAEGASNLIVANNGTAFNVAKRNAFYDLSKTHSEVGLAFYPAPILAASLRKPPLEAEPVSSVPSSIRPEITIKQPKKNPTTAANGPVFGWSLAMPGSKRVKQLQQAVLANEWGAQSALLEELNFISKAIMTEEQYEE